MKKVFLIISVIFVLSSCTNGSKQSDLAPIINGQFKDAKSVFYPSTDYKVAAVIVDKNGDVWYLRMNGNAVLKDYVKLFNVSSYK